MSQLRFPDGKIKPITWLETHSKEAQRELEQCYAAGERVKCLCHGARVPADQAPLLYIRFTDKYILARMPGTKDDHHPSCIFSHEYAQASDKGEVSADSAYKDLPDGKFSLTPAFQLDRNIQDAIKEKAGVPEKQHHTKGRTGATLLGMLQFLWEKSGNNRYYPNKQRNWPRTAWFLEQTISHGKIGNKPMSETVYTPIWKRDDSHKRQFWQWADGLAQDGQSGKVGVLIGSVRSFHTHDPFGGDAIEFTLDDLPASIRLTIPAQKAFLASYQRFWGVLAHVNANSSVKVVAIFLVSNGHRTDANGKLVKCLVASKSSIMMTTKDYIPIESKYELMMADALAQAKRAYVKPIKWDGTQDTLPDFVLIDERPATFVEVFGVSNDTEYNQRKQQKIALYKERGQKLISWDAASGHPIPVIPEILPVSST
jgi:hypothetical protein